MEHRTNQPLRLSAPAELAAKTAEFVIVAAPLLAGLFIALRRPSRVHRSTAVILAAGAAASLLLMIFLHIPHERNEYKYMFIAGICLAPFPAVMFSRYFQMLGRMVWPAFAVFMIVLASPYFYKVYKYWPWFKKGPSLDTSHFSLRLDGSVRSASLYDAVRERTPKDAVLVTEDRNLEIAALTRRKLYVPLPETALHPGLNLKGDYVLLDVKGYDPGIVKRRRREVTTLLAPAEPQHWRASLDRIRALRRPLALILETRRHQALLSWLQSQGIGAPVYNTSDHTVWLIDSTSRPA
jgi:hypothetical protein